MLTHPLTSFHHFLPPLTSSHTHSPPFTPSHLLSPAILPSSHSSPLTPSHLLLPSHSISLPLTTPHLLSPPLTSTHHHSPLTSHSLSSPVTTSHPGLISDPALQGLTDRLGTSQHDSEHTSDYSELEHAGQGLIQQMEASGQQGMKKVISLDDIAEMAKIHQQTPPGSEPSSFLVLSSGARYSSVIIHKSNLTHPAPLILDSDYNLSTPKLTVTFI